MAGVTNWAAGARLEWSSWSSAKMVVNGRRAVVVMVVAMVVRLVVAMVVCRQWFVNPS